MVAMSRVMVKAMAENVPMMAIVLLIMSFFAFSMPALMSLTSCSQHTTAHLRQTTLSAESPTCLVVAAKAV
jgi:hypothetical protein